MHKSSYAFEFQSDLTVSLKINVSTFSANR